MLILKESPQTTDCTSEIFCEILNSNKDLGFIINLEKLNFEYISDRCKEVLGFSAIQIENMGVDGFYKHICPADLDRLNEKVENSSRCHFLTDVVYRIKCNKKKYRFIREKREILYSKSNKPSYMVCSFEKQ